ncbi:MAG: hypothetical protein WAN35_14255 [Terracidiphilus sp.]
MKKFGFRFKLSRYPDGLALIRQGFVWGIKPIFDSGRIPKDVVGAILADCAGDDHNLGGRLAGVRGLLLLHIGLFLRLLRACYGEQQRLSEQGLHC